MVEEARRRWRWPLLGLVGLPVVWAIWLGVHLALAAGDVRAGIDAMEEARDRSQPSDIVEGRPIAPLREAHGRFDRAHRRLTGPTWAPARLLPFAGRQLRSLSALAGAAEEVADVSGDAVSDFRDLLAEGSPTGSTRVTLVRRLADVAGRTEQRLGRIDLGPRRALLGSLAERRNELAEELIDLRESLAVGSIGGRAVADLLEGPRRYLVFAANNAEMRAGAGMFLSVGELETRDGTLSLGQMESVTNIPVPPDAVSLSGDLAARWGWLRPNEDWRNLMLSPRFDASAELAARMWQAIGHEPVDGVIALDPVTMQALLAATGPVTVEDQTISSDNVVEELLHGQYVRFPTLAEKGERREQLGAIARATFDILNAGGRSVQALAEGLADAARGRHVMIWSARPDEQAAWAAAGVDGSLADDSLLLSVINRSGTKLDQFLDVSADLAFQPSGGDTEGTLTVVLSNRVPDSEPTYIAGPDYDSGLERGVYLGIVTANLPATTRDARVDGVDQLAVAGGDGPTRVVGVQVPLAAGESRTVTIRFRLPGRAGTVVVEPTARIPGVEWTSGDSRWSDGGSHTLRWRSRPDRG